MKAIKFKFLFLIMLMGTTLFAQNTNYPERYGNTLNLGLGVGGYSGYYQYVGHSLPVFHINYEFGVARNFTIAPFLTFYSYQEPNYRETVVPIGAKGTYYFDELFRANPNWDFYAAGSLGFSIISTSWKSGYNGDRTYYQGGSPIFLDLHIGTEYHLNNRLGIFLDLSTGVSTIGLAIH